MAKLKICKVGDEVLTKVCRPVDEITPRTLTLLDDMIETMRHADGCGLAAPQVGILRRIAVVEVEEGEVWEAAMFASAKHLDNLVAIVDNNNLQIDGTLEEVNSPYPIDEKFAAFGWYVIKINGHNFDQIDRAFDEARRCKGKPTVIIAKTVKGKGVSYMEYAVEWHGKAPKEEEYLEAMSELREELAELDSE